MLNDLQKDVLGEILNTQIGYAASLLSDMINQKIILSVPEIELDTGSSINYKYYQENGGITPGNAVVSSIKFGNNFNGNAFIFFPVDKAKVLVNSCLGMEMEDEHSSGPFDFNAEDLDVLKEICNIIFNAIIGEFGNLLKVRLDYTAPDMEIAMFSSVDQDNLMSAEIHVMALYTSFFLMKSQIRGVILIALTVDSVNMLIDKINKMLDDIL